MSKGKKVLLTVAGSLIGLIVVMIIAAVITLQTSWFANFAREKIIAAVEDSTGGVVEIGSFDIDLSHLTIRIRDFVLHGLEPKGSDPLARISLLELKLKLFSGLKKVVDLRYLGIEQPRVNLMLLPDGSTNIPQPKTPKQPSNTSGLQTVVNLAVSQFRLENGTLRVSQQKTAFSARGENLRVLLNYNALQPSYIGSLAIDPLLLSSGNKPPLRVQINVPITLEQDAVQIAGARLSTGQSQATISASMQNMNAPVISANLNASISLPEIQKSLDLPIDANALGAPKLLNAQLAVSVNEKTDVIQIHTAHAVLGQTTFQASGDLKPNRQGTVQFNANLALTELTRLLNVSGMQVGGDLQANGRATLDQHSNYAVDGTLNSRGLALRSGTTELSALSFSSPFHADPYLISLDGLRVTALGGSLSAKIFLEKLQNLSVEGSLRNFSVPVLAAAFSGKHLDYDGAINGLILAKGDLKAKGTTGYTAQTRLEIVPGMRGVPIRGRLNANYVGTSGSLDLRDSYVAMPNSRLDLTGSLNRRIDLKLVSHNFNDFLPAVNFGSAKPETTLPVTLQGGTALLEAQVTGNLSSPHIVGHIDLSDFAVEQRPFNHLVLDVTASPAEAVVRNGLLTGRGLDTSFDASVGLVKWQPGPKSPVSANVALRNGDLADLASLAGESSIGAEGQATADVHVNGTYGNPLGHATLQVTNGKAYEQPFSKFLLNAALVDQLITLSQLELDTAGGSITASGTFRHPRDSFTVGHAQFEIATDKIQLADVQALAKQNAGVAGLIQLTASGAADVRSNNTQSSVAVSNITADLSARGLRIQNQDAGSLTATARTANGTVQYKLVSNFAGSDIAVRGNTTLAKGYATTADLSLQNLSVSKALQLAGQGAIPARGDLSANAHVSGTADSPNAELRFALLRANVYQEPINRLEGSIHYSNRLVDIPSIKIDVPAGSLALSGAFDHPAGNFNAGSVRLKLNSSDIEVGRIEHVQQANRGATGTLRLTADLSANLKQERGKPQLLFSNLNAAFSAGQLRLDKRNVGGMNFTARTSGSNLDFRLDSDIAQSQIHGSGRAQLTGDYPLRANVSFANVKYSNIAPLLSSESTVSPLPLDALAEGQISVNGPILNLDNLTGRFELNRLDLRTNPKSSVTGAPSIRTVELQNEGPIVLALSHDLVEVQQLRINGRDTSINASGTISLRDPNQALALNLTANLDLGLLQDVDRDFYSSGALSLNTAIRGSFAQPRANGRIELKNANVNYSVSPNGLSNANGVILLNGTNASIENLTGESGGGKIALTGFAGFGTGVPSFNVRATATKVRVRYSGVSATSNASIALTGNVKRSLLAGTVTIERIAYESSSDAGSLLSVASTPPSAPSTPSPLLSGLRLDIHVLTAPDLQVVSSYSNRLSILANLTVRGTAEIPGMLGRVTVTDGQLVFFGNTYTVTTGNINFYDPTSISPILNVSLDTIAQGVDVTIGVSGPMDDLKLSYRSDPPLSFEQIVQLLATNTTPYNPEIAAHQPNPAQQSLSQMGESAVLGQAVANPLASRVQRVFGLTQFKIDPSVSGSNGQPDARVTLQQKVTSNITFTYITDINQANAQIIRIQWDLTNRLSAVGLRDYNGNVSVEMFYKFTKR